MGSRYNGGEIPCNLRYLVNDISYRLLALVMQRYPHHTHTKNPVKSESCNADGPRMIMSALINVMTWPAIRFIPQVRKKTRVTLKNLGSEIESPISSHNIWTSRSGMHDTHPHTYFTLSLIMDPPIFKYQSSVCNLLTTKKNWPSSGQEWGQMASMEKIEHLQSMKGSNVFWLQGQISPGWNWWTECP